MRLAKRAERMMRTERVVRPRAEHAARISLTPGSLTTPKRLGVYRRQSPVDCGNPRCWLCHSEKLSGKLRPRDIRRLDAAYV